MGQQVMLLATKPNNLSLSPRSDKVEGENQLQRVVLRPPHEL